MYSRYLKLELKRGESAFLWGARKTGKSTYLKELFKDSAWFDLLDNALRVRYTKEPWKFREDVLALAPAKLQLPIVVDEVQKVPAILDEIHWLIENKDCGFVMCGSSARQMKRVGVNLLGGRALKYNFYPLVFPEIKGHFDLLKVFNNGLLPSHYAGSRARQYLKAYLRDYLVHEVHAEGLARNLDLFSRFLDCVAFSHGEMLNYSNIARDVGIASNTVKEYYHILVDTIMGYMIYPYRKSVGRSIITSMPKFYLFDLGLASTLLERTLEQTKGSEAGKCLEHYVFLELAAYINLHDLDHRISYWRTKTGIEVDFILHTKTSLPIPIEVKISDNVHKTELKGLKVFMQEHGVKKGYMVSMESRARLVQLEEGEIMVYPAVEFLDSLWNRKLF